MEEVDHDRGTSLGHIPALDGLRGAAVAGVLAFHDGRLTGGYLGVDLFFVLSGYLITSLLIAEAGASRSVSLGRFWSRRARRLLPALLLVVVAVALSAPWLVEPTSQGWLRDEGLATLGYVANIHTIAAGGGYWQQSGPPSLLQHTWSLSIEEQFYVVWPLVVLAVLVGRGRRRARLGAADPAGAATVLRTRVRLLTAVALAAALASGALMVALALGGADRDRVYLGTDTRIAAVLLGAVAAGVHRLWARELEQGRAGRLLRTLAWPAVAILAGAWLWTPGDEPALYRGGLFLVSLAGAVLLLRLVIDQRGVLSRILTTAPLRGLGLISYGLYLWHWPVYQWLHPDRFDVDPWAITTSRVTVSVALALASYRLVEHPIRHGALRPRMARIATPAAAGVAVLALVLGTAGAVSPVVTSPEAGYTRGPAPWPTVLVVGDSTAVGLAADGLVPLAPEHRIRVVDRADIGCLLVSDNVAPDPNPLQWDCSPSWPGHVAELAPDIVLVLFGRAVGDRSVPIDGTPRQACDPAFAERLGTRLADRLDQLGEGGATVVVANVPNAIQRQKGDDPAEFDRQHDCMNRTFHDAAARADRVTLIDLDGWLCPDGTCREETGDGHVLRLDTIHFRFEGAEEVARWIIPQLLRARP